MTNSAYYQVLSRESLDDTWQRLYRRTKPSSRNTAGVDGISINDFERDAKANLSRLSKEIRQGFFKLSPLSPSLIPKPNGKDRLICVPTVRDRLVQRALLSFLATKYGKIIANKISYGFIQHRSVKMAAEAAISLRSTYLWAFKTDITSFFDRIPRDRLTHAIRSLVKEMSLHQILTEIIGCEIALRLVVTRGAFGGSAYGMA
ncbi:reverse transcriptase domain-containing protein [Cupriavidus sp. 2KB_3]|uniref:reverse transcriptase domain-containing protein n=1 Tax=Cupriavidus sp. 2KB_3 TaxID=3232980 RepID=UPI003F920667